MSASGTSTKLLYLPVNIQGTTIQALIDSEAIHNYIDSGLLVSLGIKPVLCESMLVMLANST